MVKISTNIMNFLKNLFYTKDEVNTQLSNKANTSHSHSDANVSVTTANYGEGINQDTFNGYLSYDMLTVKDKLDGIDEGANKTTVDSSLSSSSSNPVQNKVINSALDEKAASSHTHLGREIYPDFSVDSDGVSKAAYRKILRITITRGYCDEPITFNLSQRREAMHSRVHISFKTVSGIDPDLNSFYIEGIKSMPLYLYKEGASKWILLSKEVSNYDHVSINELLITNRSRDYFTLTPLNELVTTLPTSDIYTATNTIDSSLSSTSTNAVQNKVINSALSVKADSSHTHEGGDISTEGSVWDMDYGITNQRELNDMLYNDVYDKVKNIEDEANKTTVDSSLSSSSTNPVQNKVIQTALDEKASTEHTHVTSDIGFGNNDDLIWSAALGLTRQDEINVELFNVYNKVSGIEDDANKYTLPTASSSTLGGIKVGSNLSINNGVLSATNTTYGTATTSANGLMSSSDKSKLDGVASNANNYSLPTASSSTLGGVKVGTNLSISNGVLSATNTTYSTATTSANGLMSSSDKSKLDGIATGANKITVDSSLSSSSTNPVQNKVVNSALSGKASTSVATTSANGLMSSSDKTKLNGIATGATKVTVDSSLSSTSTNPVQNKVINTALAGKAASSHTHNDYTDNGKLSISGNGSVYAFKKNGWVIVYWENLGPTNTDTWFTHCSLPYNNQAARKIYAYFNSGVTKVRVRVSEMGELQSYNVSSMSGNATCYGFLMFPTDS